MNIKQILCPIDFSEFNESANEHASALAKANGARIVYLHVAQPEIPYASYAYINVEDEEKEAMRMLHELKPTVEGVEASYAVEFGVPAEQIVQYANENDIDMIVVGTHGRTGLRRVLMGSVAEAVVRKAECPVLAFKARTNVPAT